MSGFDQLNHAERMARVEEQVKNLADVVEKLDAKIDSLLELRNKGIGAFWLMSLLFGTGIAGIIITWFGGVR